MSFRKEEIRRLTSALRYVLGDAGPTGACAGTMLQRARDALAEWGEGGAGGRVREMLQFVVDGAAGRGVCAWGRHGHSHGHAARQV